MQLTDTGWLKCQAELEATATRTLGTTLQGRFDVADVVQESLIQIWRRESEEHEVSVALVRCIARGHSLKAIRRHTSAKRDARREQPVHSALRHGAECPYEECLRKELATVLTDAIERLEPIARYVVRRHIIDDWPVSGIAESLGRTPQTCGRLLKKSLRALRFLIIEALGRLTGEHRQADH